MKYVQFSAFVGTGVVEIFGKIIWHKGKFSAEGGRKEMLERLLDEPVRNLGKKGCPKLTRRDGLQFLEALPYFYNGYALCADLVKEQKGGKNAYNVEV